MRLFKPAFKIGVFVMLMWGTAMLVPLLVTWYSWPQSMPFIAGATCCYLVALVLRILSKGALPHLQSRAIVMVTAFNWLLIMVTGTIPFLLTTNGLSVVDALFEVVSGITTSGGSIYSDLEQLPTGIMLWRGLTQWIGGIGVILVAVAILPSLQSGGMRLFRSEFSEWAQLEGGRIGEIALHIIVVYSVISVACLLAFKVFGMSWFDAVFHMMATVSTGGFGTYNNSFGFFGNGPLLVVASVFMLLGACPFLLMMTSLRNRSLRFLRDSQVLLLLKLVFLATLSISLWRFLQGDDETLGAIVRSSLFNVVSIITTTGFASEDYQFWGSFPVVVLFFFTFTGSCSGSTAGGIKLFRFQMLYLFMKEQIFRALHPNVVYQRQYNGQPIREDVLLGSLAFIFFVVITWTLSALMLAASGLDPVTSVTGAIAALSNVGPGFGDVIGPVGNYSSLSDFAKLVLSGDMLLGRLEYMALVIIFTRDFWTW